MCWRGGHTPPPGCFWLLPFLPGLHISLRLTCCYGDELAPEEMQRWRKCILLFLAVQTRSTPPYWEQKSLLRRTIQLSGDCSQNNSIMPLQCTGYMQYINNENLVHYYSPPHGLIKACLPPMENETTVLLCYIIPGWYNRIIYASCDCKSGKQKMNKSEKSEQQYISPCKKANLLLLFAFSMDHWQKTRG